MKMKRFEIEFQPAIPPALKGLEELANDLYYSWNVETRMLFRRLDKALWEKCNHNPKLFLRHVCQDKLDDAVSDSSYMEEYARILSGYSTYRNSEIYAGFQSCLDVNKDLVAYFCLEFGFHESIPIYSGGLGILAGDVCKAASDMAVPFVGVGLLYRQGYFSQQIDNYGNQIALYHPTAFENLPITPCSTDSEKELKICINLPSHDLIVKVWEANAGNMKLYLLDTDIPQNSMKDRQITHQLYGGGKDMRILQEILLGIGGVRALRALKINPTVWHINEGHAAFSTIERCHESILQGMDFTSALELNSSNVVFTTHTPVPAGHDIFTRGQIHEHFHEYVKALGLEFETFFALGRNSSAEEFNMTSLALRSSRFHNGVSQIHGNVASEMEAYVWPQISPEENPIGYVTNGVHISTFLAREWINLLDMRFGDWRRELNNPEFWDCLDKIPSHRFWSLRRELKTILLSYVHEKIAIQFRRNGFSDATVRRNTELISQHNKDILILGFARRFATYKRADLLFYDLERLTRILSDPDKPTILLLAGKAHPEDHPGQDLIRKIHDISQRAELQGKVILIEDYDLALARRLVAGVDVWINTPEYPMEASGTSGQKAGMNGVLNLSVLDGWWNEGFNEKNGWAISPHGWQFDHQFRQQQEATDLLDIIENEIVPSYFDRNTQGFSPTWVELAKESMKSIIPNFNAQRMLSDYVQGYYSLAIKQFEKISDNNNQNAVLLRDWKERVKKAWPKVSIKCISDKPCAVQQGTPISITIAAKLNGLTEHDVIVECLFSEDDVKCSETDCKSFYLKPDKGGSSDEKYFSLAFDPKLSGLNYMKIRMYPHHELLCHKFEMGCMVWLET